MQPLNYELSFRCRTEAVMKLFDTHDQISHAMVLQVTGLHPATCSHTMNDLIRAGLITRVKKGLYRLGFNLSLKDSFVFTLSNLNQEPNRVLVKKHNGKRLYFWVSRNGNIENLQAFGCFSSYAGQIANRVEESKEGEICLEQKPGMLRRMKSFFTGKTL